MTRDHAIRRAKHMRDRQTQMLKVASNARLPWGERYGAVIMAEDYEEAARRLDAYAEREKAK